MKVTANNVPNELPDLPKWPQLVVTSDQKLSKEQVNLLMLQTTDFTSLDTNPEMFAYSNKITKKLFDVEVKCHNIDFMSMYEAMSQIGSLLRKKNPCSLYHLANHQFTNAWVGGAHGWLNWDGSIKTSEYCIGKWPSSSDVVQEAILLKDSYPWLEMTIQLFNVDGIDEGKKPTPLLEIKLDADGVNLETENLREPLIPLENPDYSNLFSYFPRNIYKWDLVELSQLVNTLKKENSDDES